MALSLGTDKTPLAMQERTWRVELFCEAGEEARLVMHRETVGLRPDGSVATRSRDVPPVQRTLSQIADQDFDGMTGAQLAQKLWDVGDALRQEDIDNPAPPFARPDLGGAAQLEEAKAAADEAAKPSKKKA